jgi:peptide/nickel transport system permease protein
MLRYVLKRILLLIPVIIAVSFIVFALMELTPGTIVDIIVARAEGITPEEIEELRIEHNLHRSMFFRYGVYMANLIRGDLGVSPVTGRSVWTVFMQRLPYTLILSFTALLIGMAVAVPMGIIASRNAGKLADNAASVLTLIGMSMPVFWVGLILIIIFSGRLGWLPSAAAGETPLEFIRSLILPAICSGLSLTASTARQTRSSMLEVLRADILRTARAKGVPSETVIRKHALGNAWIPIITAAGASFCAQLAGSVVVESVFAWPGIGRMAAEAVFSRDEVTLLGTIILTTVLYVLVQMIIDILYAFIDPRIKSQYISVKPKKKEAVA